MPPIKRNPLQPEGGLDTLHLANHLFRKWAIDQHVDAQVNAVMQANKKLVNVYNTFVADKGLPPGLG